VSVVSCATSACGGQTRITLAEGFPDEGGAGSSGPTLDLIDDMEDGDERLPIPLRDGRSGHWATYNDGAPATEQWPQAQGFFVMSAISPPRGSSTYAARTYGRGLQTSTGWASMEMSVMATIGNPDVDAGSRAADAGLPQGLYDASVYKGITLYARVGDNSQKELRLNVATLQTLPQGGVCTMCYDSFGKILSLGTEWKQIVLPFAELSQRGFGDPVSFFDSAHVYTIDFAFVGPQAFDLWIDDVAFYR